MPIWLIVVIVVIVVFLVFALLGTKESKQAGEQAGNMLFDMEQKYNDYVERKLNNQIISEDNFDFDIEALTAEVMIFLAPDIQSLISFINSTIYSGARTDYKALYFSNIPHLINEMFEKSTRRKDATLTKEDEAKFKKSFETAIKSNLTVRINNLKSGSF
jgi:predicted PurR-regulated permease PerM